MKIGENRKNFSSPRVFCGAEDGNRSTRTTAPRNYGGNAADSPFYSSAALFDSGIGGLNVLFACRRRMSDEKFIYYGDNDRAPYGNLPEDVIVRYVLSAAEELSAYAPRVLALACNTATACAGKVLRKTFSFPVLGAYPPVLTAGKCGGDGLVLVTRATHQSAAFAALMRRAESMYPAARFFSYPCDFLAGKVEDTQAAAEESLYTAELPKRRFSFVVLGCTHYAHVKKAIGNFYACPVFDGTENLSRRIEQTLSAPAAIACDEAERAAKTEREAQKNAYARPAVTTFAPDAGKYVSSDGKVLFLGSGAQKNKMFYEHSFADALS